MDDDEADHIDHGDRECVVKAPAKHDDEAGAGRNGARHLANVTDRRSVTIDRPDKQAE